MGVAGSPDIFQANMSELMAALEFVHTYLDDILVISKASLENQLKNLRKIFLKLREARCKLTLTNCHFVLLQQNTWVIHLLGKVSNHIIIKYKQYLH